MNTFDVFKPLDRSNVQGYERPVVVRRVQTFHPDRDGQWKKDKTEGILQNPGGRCPKRFPCVTGEI